MKFSRHLTASLLLLLSAGGTLQAQQQGSTASKPAATTTQPAPASSPASSPAALSPATAPLQLARAAYIAHGGDRFRDLKNIVLRGSVDLYSPNSTQALGGQFAIIFAGDKFRMEIQSPAFSMRSIFDGEQSYSSMPQFALPPLTRYGYSLLTGFDRTGNTVSALADKKKLGFRVTTADGTVTDFYLDPKTNRVQRFTIPIEDNLSYGVEHKTFKEIDGVPVPLNFTLKFETPQGIFFAEAKSKIALVNQTLDADVFAIPAP